MNSYTDAQGKVLTVSTIERPFYVERRWFLVDFWIPKGAFAVDLTAPEEATVRLPEKLPLEISEATIQALDAAPRFELARHRREP